MALILENSDCPLCGKLLKGKEIVSFTSFIENPMDELIFANDAAFHRECLANHPSCERLIERSEIYTDTMTEFLASRHKCVICNISIDQPDEYFGLGFFTYNSQNPLYSLNYRVCHYSCFMPGIFPAEIVRELQVLKTHSEISPGKLALVLDLLGLENIDHSCAVCGQEIIEPSKRFYFGETLFHPPHPLSQYSNKVCHHQCLNKINYARYYMKLTLERSQKTMHK